MPHAPLNSPLLVALLSLAAAPALAAPVVDGALTVGEYGPAKSTVGYNPAAPTSNFGAPTNENASVGYSVYLTSTSTALFGLLQANPTGGGSAAGVGFANLYFDLDRQNGNGSDLGFEITNQRAFIPGVAGFARPRTWISRSAWTAIRSSSASLTNC